MTYAPTILLDPSATPRPVSIFRFRRTPDAKARRQGGNGILPIAAVLSLFQICAFVAPKIGGEVGQGGNPPLCLKTTRTMLAPLEWTLGDASYFSAVHTPQFTPADIPPKLPRLKNALS
jgi:hypothetical protein